MVERVHLDTEARAVRAERDAAKYERLHEVTRGRIARIATARLVSFLVFAVFAFAAFKDQRLTLYGPIAAVGLLTFIVALVLHRAPFARAPRLLSLAAVHRSRAARLRGDFGALPEDGRRFIEAGLPQSTELQVFGRVSLYQILCRAALPNAQERLASRLMGGLPSVSAIEDAQRAARALSPRRTFRHRFEAEGRLVNFDSKRFEAFVGWAEEEIDRRFSSRCFVLASALVPLTWASIIGAVTFDLPTPWRVLLGVQVAFYFAASGRLSKHYETLLGRDEAQPFLGLRRMFQRVERLRCADPTLKRLIDSLRIGEHTPSMRMKRLEAITDALAVRLNPLSAFVANALFLWEPINVARLVAWRWRHGKQIRSDLDVLAELEVLSGMAGYAADFPDSTFPEVRESGDPVFAAEALGHPLFAESRRKTNDFALISGGRLVLVTGSNMAGKSSFLRTLGVNVLLAQCGAPVCARSLILTRCRPLTSIQITDSPEQGLSRFYAEVKRIRTVLDACGLAENRAEREANSAPAIDPPCLYLIDEMLSGTNSRERNLASLAIAGRLLAFGRSYGLITTHDLSMVALEARYPERVRTCHFTDRFDGVALHFDYQLRDGVAVTTNALDVLRLEGIEVDETDG